MLTQETEYLKNTTHITIANVNDVNAIAEIHVKSWQKRYVGIVPDKVLKTLSVTAREEMWRKLMNKNTEIYVMLLNGCIIGFASICESRDENTNKKNCGEISALHFNPDYWRKGFGTKLCIFVLDKLAKMNFTEVILWVVKENMDARKFYESIGFIETNHNKVVTYPDFSLNEIRYKKHL